MVINKLQSGKATTPAAWQVLIVDDEASVREGLSRLLDTEAEPWGTVRSAATLAEARGCIARLHPDVVLLDVDLAGDDGLALLPELTPRACVVVLSSHADAVMQVRAARMGAAALVDKYGPASHLLAELHRLAITHLRGDEAPTRSGRWL